MRAEEVSGPGVGAWLIEHLQAWGIQTLTDVQAQAIASGIADGRSMAVSAPTSSGKTLIGEIGVLCALRNGARAIYLVSHKALADQKYKDFLVRFGEHARQPLATVGLSTGDRTEGDLSAQLMVATYEKALGLFLSGQLRPEDAVVVADELQIIGEPGRGPDIEVLCSAFRQRGVRQFVALTATVENAEDLAGWLECQLVRSVQRDVPLLQEIWYQGRVWQTRFGDDEAQEITASASWSADVSDVVERLLQEGRGPVLVFTESRRETTTLAAAFVKRRPRGGDGIALAQQLELFSEPTESSDQLRESAERRVAFHSADLSSQERQVIEGGFVERKFDVCFATSTLAAGVNFPFRSVVFPKITHQWGGRAGTMLFRGDYRNMSGRAGRLGMHPDGYSILLPRNNVEFSHASMLVSPENERLVSQLFSLSARKTLLMLVASGLASTHASVMEFFKNSLYWYQTLDRNPVKLSELSTITEKAAAWLVDQNLLLRQDETFRITPLGSASAMTGLLPSTSVNFANLLRGWRAKLQESFADSAPGLIYAACASDEFCADPPSRFLPYPARQSYESVTFWATKQLPVPLDRADVRLAQCAHAMALYSDGVGERQIAYATGLSSGMTHRMALDVAWVLDGLHRISTVGDLGVSQGVSNQLSMLARRVRWGAPIEALDVLRVAERHGVPGLGRQRVMALLAQGIKTLHDVLGAARDRLIQVLRNESRADALVAAASSMVGLTAGQMTSAHLRRGRELGIESLIASCNEKLGEDYEDAIRELLEQELRWTVTELDDGVRQNVPDLMIRIPGTDVLIECKTCTKSPPLIKKEEAWAVLQKAADFDRSIHRVTLGKPAFDETSKAKAAGAQDITLIENAVFIEGVLRVLSGTVSPEEFVAWISLPGVAEIERLGGAPTYIA